MLSPSFAAAKLKAKGRSYGADAMYATHHGHARDKDTRHFTGLVAALDEDAQQLLVDVAVEWHLFTKRSGEVKHAIMDSRERTCQLDGDRLL